MARTLNRRRRLSCLFWVTCILLQQCREVLLVNVILMQNEGTPLPNSRSYDNNTQSNFGHRHVSANEKNILNRKEYSNLQDKREESDAGYLQDFGEPHNYSSSRISRRSVYQRNEEVRNLLNAVKKVTRNLTLKKKDIEKLKGIVCQTFDFEHLQQFWKKQEVAYNLYLLSSAVVANLGSCHAVLMSHIEALVDNLGSEDAIELLEESVPIIESFEKNTKDENIELDEDNQLLEPESPEKQHFKQMSHILVDSIDKVHIFADVLNSENKTHGQTIAADLEEKIEETMLEYDILSSVLDVQPKRKLNKRAADNVISKQEAFRMSEVHNVAALKSFTSLSKEKEGQLHFKALKNIGNNYEQDTRKDFNKDIDSFIYPDLQGKETRIQRSAENYESLVMIRNEKYPCKLLSVCGNNFCLKLYDDESLIDQLWVWENGFLQHRGTLKYASRQTETNILSLQHEIPTETLTLTDHRLLTLDFSSNCTIFIEGEETESQILKFSCQKQSQKWTFTKFHEAKESISSIACLFFIQDIKTCSMVTPEYLDEIKTLAMKPVDRDNFINQVWQWDQQYIRHYNTKLYLTSGLKDTLSLEEIPRDKWNFYNNRLYAAEAALDITNGKVTMQTSSKSHVNLPRANEKDAFSCEKHDRYFAIKHLTEPCKVLCTKWESVGPDNIFRVIAISSSFVAGMLIGLISLACTGHNKAFSTAFAIGFLFAAVSAVVLEYCNLFWNDFQTVEFQEFLTDKPLTCLWHDFTGTLRSADNDKGFSMESWSDGNLIVHLNAEANQTWLIKNGSITSEVPTSCRITLKDENILRQSNILLFSCEETFYRNSSWTKVIYDNDSIDFRRQVVCMYFLRQTNKQTCTFLTGSENVSEPKPQIYSKENLLNQIWYSYGDSFKNVGTDVSFNKGISNIEKIPFDESDEIFSVLRRCHKNMFFIQSENFPCKLLAVSSNAGVFSLSLHEYSVEMYLNQLWTNDDNHLYNIGTGIRIATHNNLSETEFIISKGKSVQYDYWKIDNKTIRSTNSECSLSAQEVNGDIEVHCRNRSQSKWNIVSFDENFDFLKYVLCTFFVQNRNPPCAFLTANSSNKLVFLEYMAADVIDDQLWIMSDGQLVNLRSGLPLNVKSQGKEITLENNETVPELKWTYQNNKLMEINSKEYLFGFASVRIATENQILIKKSKFWHIIHSDLLMDHIGMFPCQSSDTKFFFLKNEIRPCELLTAVNGRHLSFEAFDETLIENQLWYIENGRLFNVYTGNVIKFIKNASGIYNIELSEMLIYDPGQIIYTMQDKIVHVYNTTHECFLSYEEHDGNYSLSCQFAETNASKWKRIEYNEDVSNIEELVCLFFLKNKLAPCEYLTGYEEGKTVKIRPQIYELIDNQMFYWKNEYIVHLKTGLLLTTSIQHSSDVTLQEEDIESETFYQRWSAFGSQFAPLFHKYLTLDVNTDVDGKIILTKSYYDNQTTMSQQWTQESYNTLNNMYGTEPEDQCNEVKTSTEVFFIRSKKDPCLVLAGSDQGSMPNFEVFDIDNIDRFLWIYDSHHFVNFETGLALMLDFEDGSLVHNVILWQYYAFSLAQKWTRSQSGVFHSGLLRDCVLHSGSLHGTLTMQSACADLGNSDLEMVIYEEDADVISNLTCTFFIRSNAQHCELLTHIGNNQIRTRPLFTNQDVLHQLWYWKGNKLVNYGNNRFLIFSNTSNTVMLHQSYESHYGYSWLYTNSFFKSQQMKNAFITVSERTGELVINSILQKSPELQHWVLIGRDKGIDNPNHIICDHSNKDHTLYVIRSEHGSCPLLMATESGSIGVAKMSDSFSENGLWGKDGSHIVHISRGKCLSVKKSSVYGSSIFLQQKYFYERLQQWSTIDDVIKSKYTHFSQYLTYTGSNVVMENRLSNNDKKQKWKWYTVGQIENDDKLLRCSRCYNKGEETASEVISFIPIFGFLYNIGRSIAYGAKNCPDVALSSLVDGLIDVAFDVVVALSAGSASALAYGVKTGVKFGIKAGLKAVKTAVKSMIKVTFKSMKSNFIKFLRRGLKKTIKGQLTRIQMKSKVTVSVLKKGLKKVKTLKGVKLNRVKSIFRKGNKFTNSFKFKGFSAYRRTFKFTINKLKTSLSKLPRLVQRKTKYIQNKVKDKVKDFGNSLADRAEKAVKKANDISGPIDRIYRRCKRALGNCFKQVFGSIKDYKEDLPPVPRTLERDLDQLSRLEVTPDRGQTASIGLKQDDVFINTKTENTANLRKSKATPEYKSALSKNEIKMYEKQNIKHTEQDLFEKIEHDITHKCNSRKPCEVVLYSKLSPCHDRKPPAAKTCLEYLTGKCKTWFENYSTTCFIVFKTSYGNDIFTRETDDTLAAMFGKPTHQKNIFDESENDVARFAMNCLDDIDSRKLCQTLKFSEDQIKIFDQSLSEAVEITKRYDLSSFWHNLFAKLDFGNAFQNVKFEDVQKQVKIMLRESLNKEAKKRQTVKAINDMKTSVGANGAFEFYRI